MWLAIKVSAAQESVRCLVIQHTISWRNYRIDVELVSQKFVVFLVIVSLVTNPPS